MTRTAGLVGSKTIGAADLTWLDMARHGSTASGLASRPHSADIASGLTRRDESDNGILSANLHLPSLPKASLVSLVRFAGFFQANRFGDWPRSSIDPLADRIVGKAAKLIVN